MSRAGNDMQAVFTHRVRAEIAERILRLHGYAEVMFNVRREFPGFAKANHKGYTHNADGLTLALKQIDAINPVLGRVIREACGLKVTSEYTKGQLAEQRYQREIDASNELQ